MYRDSRPKARLRLALHLRTAQEPKPHCYYDYSRMAQECFSAEAPALACDSASVTGEIAKVGNGKMGHQDNVLSGWYSGS